MLQKYKIRSSCGNLITINLMNYEFSIQSESRNVDNRSIKHYICIYIWKNN